MNKMTQKKYPVSISLNVTFAEGIKSAKAALHKIENYPDDKQLENMKFIASNIFEVVRKEVALDKPIIVSSFFRHKDLNKVIKVASKTSDHPKGSAMDLKKASGAKYTNADIFNFIKDNLDFDQLIWEKGDSTEPKWVHVGLRRNVRNRKQVLYK
jgi:hypothetical protein